MVASTLFVNLFVLTLRLCSADKIRKGSKGTDHIINSLVVPQQGKVVFSLRFRNRCDRLVCGVVEASVNKSCRCEYTYVLENEEQRIQQEIEVDNTKV